MIFKRQISRQCSSSAERLLFSSSIILFFWFVFIDRSVSGLPPFAQPAPECKSLCSLAVDAINSSSGNLAQCKFIKDTYECERSTLRFLTDHTANSSDQSTGISNLACPRSQVWLNFTPYSFDHPMYLPALSLNLSVSILDVSTRAVALRLECLQSGAEKEFYCENRTRPTHWDRFYWPCRLFDFSNIAASGSSLVYPIYFNYDCFRLSALSVFVINATLYPQNCTASYTFRMPSLANVLAKSVTEWLPLVSVDANADDGVWIHFSSPPSWMRVRRVAVEIFEIINDKAQQEESFLKKKRGVAKMRKVLRRRAIVSIPDTSVFFVDLPKAVYSTVVYAEHSMCEGEKCLQMQVDFGLTKNHYTSFTKKEIDAQQSLQNAWIPVVGILIAFAVVVVAVVAYLRWKVAKRKRRQGTVTFVQFDKRPVVLILYTNDFLGHRRCVLELATYLQNRANCDVEIDEWALSSSSRSYRTPAEWLTSSLQRADYYIIVFSSGTKETIFRPMDCGSFVELRAERPWEETFAPAINFILQKVLQATRSLDPARALRDGQMHATGAFYSIACIHFSYSSPSVMPELFRTLRCPNFTLPGDLRRLLCHIHELPHDMVHENSPLDAGKLCSVITEASMYVEANPDWIRSRLVERDASGTGAAELDQRQQINDISAAVERLRAPIAEEVPENLQEFYAGILEQQNLADEPNIPGDEGPEDKYRLIPPTVGQDEPVESSATGNFELLPPDDEELSSLFHSNTSGHRSRNI